MFGYAASEMIGQHIAKIIPPDLHDEEAHILAKLAKGDSIEHYETVRVGKDGQAINVSLTISPLRDESGRVVGASKIARDITDRKQADEMQRLLVEELNHRVKNTLATVQAIAGQTLRHAQDTEEFVSSFTGRILSLSRAHGLLTRTNMQGAEITELVREQIEAGAVEEDRIALSGPALWLSSQQATHLALVLHELASNARKHGALSAPNGRLSVNWEVETKEGATLLMTWKEQSGRQISVPQRRGFGTALIEQTFQGHGGEASIHYLADGIACRIKLPLTPAERQSARRKAAGSLAASSNRPRLALKRLLVVEDHPLILMDLAATLRAAGCEVIGSVGAVERARRLIVEGEFDAAFIDTDLDDAPVEELAITLTRMNIPFAFITGAGREALPRGFGHAAMLTKPFSPEQALSLAESFFPEKASVVPLRRKTHRRS
jgi:PAS domain S-box-containing protein